MTTFIVKYEDRSYIEELFQRGVKNTWKLRPDVKFAEVEADSLTEAQEKAYAMMEEHQKPLNIESKLPEGFDITFEGWSRHLYRGSPFETSTDCGNCDGGGCDDCIKVYSVAEFPGRRFYGRQELRRFLEMQE